MKKISEKTLLTANCNCSLNFIAGVDGSMPCCFKSNASKAAGFNSVDDGIAVEILAWLFKIALKKASSSSIILGVVVEVLVFVPNLEIYYGLIKIP